MSYETGIVAVVATILGLGGLALSVGTAADLRRVIGAGDPATAEPGAVVRAEGRVERLGEPFQAPLTGDRCVGYVLAQQLRYRWGHLPVRRWQTHRVWNAVPAFALVGRRSVRVSPGRESGEPFRACDRTPPGATFSDLHLERTALSPRCESDQPPPPPVSAAVDASLEADHPHRYAEWRLDDGDAVTVVGELADVDPPTITDDGSVFVLSRGSIRPAAAALAARTAGYLAFGLGALAVAAVLLGARLV